MYLKPWSCIVCLSYPNCSTLYTAITVMLFHVSPYLLFISKSVEWFSLGVSQIAGRGCRDDGSPTWSWNESVGSHWRQDGDSQVYMLCLPPFLEWHRAAGADCAHAGVWREGAWGKTPWAPSGLPQEGSSGRSTHQSWTQQVCSLSLEPWLKIVFGVGKLWSLISCMYRKQNNWAVNPILWPIAFWFMKSWDETISVYKQLFHLNWYMALCYSDVCTLTMAWHFMVRSK